MVQCSVRLVAVSVLAFVVPLDFTVLTSFPLTGSRGDYVLALGSVVGVRACSSLARGRSNQAGVCVEVES